MRKLKDWLDDTGTTQSQLAERIGVSQPTVSAWVNGDIFPSITNLRRLAEITQLTVDELLSVSADRQSA